jgi:hypothetical protein
VKDYIEFGTLNGRNKALVREGRRVVVIDGVLEILEFLFRFRRAHLNRPTGQMGLSGRWITTGGSRSLVVVVVRIQNMRLKVKSTPAKSLE